MPFDFVPSDHTSLTRQRANKGLVNHLKGAAAEESVIRRYLAQGHSLLANRWRGQAGEIDLIFADGEAVIFVEVKASRTFGAAASHLSSRQVAVIGRAIDEYLSDLPKGNLTDIRLDLAMVDGLGRIEILENALAG